MSSKQRRTIAKEIVDQTLSHFKKQRESATVEQPRTREVERKPEKKYEPSTNFHKVFSEIMGGKTKASKNIKLNENPKLNSLPVKIDQQSKKNETEHITQSFNEKPDLPQAPQKTAEPENREESIIKPAQPSVFERLARQKNAENAHHEQEENAAQDPNKKNEEEKTVNPTAPISVFQKLSRHATTS